MIIQFLTEWATGLAVLILLVLVTDILTPSEVWRPFIKFTAGLIFLFWFINPVKHVLNDAESFTILFPDTIEKWIHEEKVNGEAVIESMTADQTAYILEQSEQSLLPLLEEKCGCEIDSLQIVQQDNEFRIVLSTNIDRGGLEQLVTQISALLEIPKKNIIISD
ncbi:stage III sporulation protein AF [Jeotgalibacillus sp. JSM ZJ347]|uniref:stage III sporulation protein AF n=1 Tax=Jeotgalibacillus sp. JSM ZJ347 TaxID=3342117 RepID=UPI0035A830CE